MSSLDKDSIHLSSDDENVAEFIATKTAGDTAELRVRVQFREINEGGAVMDILSAEPTEYEEPVALTADDETEAAMIGEIL